MRAFYFKLNRHQTFAAIGFVVIQMFAWIVCHRFSPSGAAAFCGALSVCSGLLWAISVVLPPRGRAAPTLSYLAACLAAAAGIGFLG